MTSFMECDTCRAKLGSPVLCAGCLHNRATINALKAGMKDWKPVTQMTDDCGHVLGWSDKHWFNVIDASHWIDRPSGEREYFNGNIYCTVTHFHLMEPPTKERDMDQRELTYKERLPEDMHPDEFDILRLTAPAEDGKSYMAGTLIVREEDEYPQVFTILVDQEFDHIAISFDADGNMCLPDKGILDTGYCILTANDARLLANLSEEAEKLWDKLINEYEDPEDAYGYRPEWRELITPPMDKAEVEEKICQHRYYELCAGDLITGPE